MSPNPSTITSFSLASIRETHLSRLLSVTPELKTLRWVFNYSEEAKHAPNTSLVELDKVGTSLFHVRNTLTELTISTQCDSWRYLYPPLLNTKGSLNALVGFCQLERLEIPLQFLAASFIPATAVQLKDVAPRHIQSLIIAADNLEEQEENE
ncbi:hypothetical protein P152DRAFT_193451 [Eremomyces bilateralis CBS 781.70]|uniref:Uncharacterized protein n=1 Tax=Eremomyces bilateralis CBS 781.70 TaxID=1392243 RepID=A0A6G1GC81_9PEZI|nr:uncharacterized protein P152DRAFT_193451 [Eremomyces bilateralis CBS 781.70]KAF1815697.1 hypothetical protein P152DRAFT_193451 [Eremomyces bilateralis CBS 781.70]